jgi:nucleoside-diphosphate-sugar epimerase
MKVLVTGSSGYCGIGIVKVLLEHSFTVVGFSLDGRDQAIGSPHFSSIKGDLTDFEATFGALDGIDAVVHSAVGSRVRRETPPGLPGGSLQPDFNLVTPFNINVAGTFNIFEAARQRGIHKVVNLSSCAVIYHHIIDPVDNHIHPVKVNAATSPSVREDYGVTKLLQEQIGWYYAGHYGLSVPTLRPWWVIDGETGLTRLGHRLEDDPIDALGSAGWVDRCDLGEAIRLSLEQEFAYGVFYIASTDSSEDFFDLEPTRQVLGWQPHYRFEEAVRVRKQKGMDPY